MNSTHKTCLHLSTLAEKGRDRGMNYKLVSTQQEYSVYDNELELGSVFGYNSNEGGEYYTACCYDTHNEYVYSDKFDTLEEAVMWVNAMYKQIRNTQD